MKSETKIIEVLGVELITAMDVVTKVIYVAMKPLIIGMGLDWKSQSVKLERDDRYGVIAIPYKTNGGTQEMVSLNADHLYAFLYSINPNKVRKDLREKIIAFQNETFGVINDYWKKKESLRESRVVSGYKSQIVQHNKKYTELETEYERQTVINYGLNQELEIYKHNASLRLFDENQVRKLIAENEALKKERSKMVSIDELEALKDTMVEQLKLVVTNTEREIVMRFRESLDITAIGAMRELLR